MKKFLFTIMILVVGKVVLSQTKNQLNVLQINIWQEGTSVPNGFPAIADEIIDKKADVVLFSEVRNYQETDFVQRILDELKIKGVEYYGTASAPTLDVAFISKFPIKEQQPLYDEASDMGGVLKSKIQVAGRNFTFYSVHLDYTNYACYLPRGYDGVTWKKLDAPIVDAISILEANRKGKRDDAILDIIIDADKESKDATIIIAGDFNEPSHLDWIHATKDLFDHRGAVVPWDCSVLLTKAGFVDSFREKYPNPVTHPGFTFPSFNKDVAIEKLTWAPLADERDRIDYVYYRTNKPLHVAAVKIVGPEETVKFGKKQEQDSKDEFLLPKGIWPTDHKALLVKFEF
ncbi:endonuclease [Sphingobacterium sp. ML3W]|uniref:endonuclease/exonuclease/phosphatase family protein n=1 Tax=Sphingobacterium sp. ML3W TaxID=1538644 RepID=UPI0004F7C7A0|nr:endonuclease/exonuclease/phosphatase family protein [Sphingobacterium sp. ML3W]AIM36085.1 endonuclease [Sphingobacterium sp. ML3W]